MYSKIMVPVDLAHLDALDKPLAIAVDLARHFDAALCYVSVTAALPGPVARTPDEYRLKLEAFAQRQASEHERAADARLYISHDPAIDLDDILVRAVRETDSDLVVMGTHLPRRLDAIMPANGGRVATHTDASVFLVRP